MNSIYISAVHGHSDKNGAENKIRTNQNTTKRQNSGLAIQDSDEDPNLNFLQIYLIIIGKHCLASTK